VQAGDRGAFHSICGAGKSQSTARPRRSSHR
jgi:hypothetical protein